MLCEIAARGTSYDVVASGELRDMLFNGSEQIAFAPLASRGTQPLSGAFGVSNLRN